MKKMQHNPIMFLLIMAVIPAFLTVSCSKTKSCEEDNTFRLSVQNMLPNGTIQVNIDHDFVSVNGTYDYSVKAGQKINVDVPAGEHTVYARSVVTSCSGSRCSISVTGKPQKTINQQACGESTLVY